MTIGTLKSPNARNQNSIFVIKSKFSSASSMNTLLAILKVTDARRDVILAGGMYHRFPWRHLPPHPPSKNWTRKWKMYKICRHLRKSDAWNVRNIKLLKFNLDALVSQSCFELFLWMNKLKTIDRKAFSWKFLIKTKIVKQSAQHYLDRGSVHASKIGCAHGKIQLKIHLKSGAFCNFSLAPKKKCLKRLWNSYKYIYSLTKT